MPDPLPIEAHPVAFPLGNIPIGAYPVEQSDGVLSNATALVAIIVPVPVVLSVDPVPTIIAAAVLTPPVIEENGVALLAAQELLAGLYT
jgi:hypothetical protein